ncbi:c-type cytochrome [Pedobacter sp. PWIIR3]
MKKSLLILGCLALTWASCHSPEERAAMKASADSAKLGLNAPAPMAADSAATDSATTTAAPKTDAPVVAAATTPEPAVKAEPVKAAAVAATAELPGEALIKKSDCLACHSVKNKIVGPAYVNVAAKYTAADIDHLADKIIAGGAGVWGDVPMSPHPAVSKSDAKEMVKYILSLKK